METDIYIWLYALLVMHARKEEEYQMNTVYPKHCCVVHPRLASNDIIFDLCRFAVCHEYCFYKTETWRCLCMLKFVLLTCQCVLFGGIYDKQSICRLGGDIVSVEHHLRWAQSIICVEQSCSDISVSWLINTVYIYDACCSGSTVDCCWYVWRLFTDEGKWQTGFTCQDTEGVERRGTSCADLLTGGFRFATWHLVYSCNCDIDLICSISVPVDFWHHLVGKSLRNVKLWEMFVTVLAHRHILLVSQWSFGHFLKLTDSVIFE